MYPNSITLTKVLYFDIFDEIPFKYVKELVMKKEEDREEYDFEVKIEDLPSDREAYNKVRFTFDLRCDISQGSLPLWTTKTFIKEIEYNTSSGIALTLMELDEEEEEVDKPLRVNDNLYEVCFTSIILDIFGSEMTDEESEAVEEFEEDDNDTCNFRVIVEHYADKVKYKLFYGKVFDEKKFDMEGEWEKEYPNNDYCDMHKYYKRFKYNEKGWESDDTDYSTRSKEDEEEADKNT